MPLLSCLEHGLEIRMIRPRLSGKESIDEGHSD
jgi:hypothetical protein